MKVLKLRSSQLPFENKSCLCLRKWDPKHRVWISPVVYSSTTIDFSSRLYWHGKKSVDPESFYLTAYYFCMLSFWFKSFYCRSRSSCFSVRAKLGTYKHIYRLSGMRCFPPHAQRWTIMESCLSLHFSSFVIRLFLLRITYWRHSVQRQHFLSEVTLEFKWKSH